MVDVGSNESSFAWVDIGDGLGQEAADEPYAIQQFVQDVMDFSSQYGSDISISYTAYNITGKPSKYPDYGDFPQAFVMRTYGKWWNEAPSRPEPIMPQNYRIPSQDFIDVCFELPVYPEKVSIFETFNPGSVVRIWAATSTYQWYLLWEGHPQIVGHSPRIFSPEIRQIDSMTKLLRIEFDHSKLDYYTELDAVLLVGSLSRPIDFSKIKSQFQSININVISKQQADSAILFSSLAKHYSKLLADLNLAIESCSEQSSPGSTSPVSENQDHFKNLPDETVLRIFSYLDLSSLYNCVKVNRHFYRLASDNMLYTAINLMPYWYFVDNNALCNLIPKCQYLQKIDLSWCGNYGKIEPESFVDFIANCGKQIVIIRLDCCKFIDDSCLNEIVRTCRNIRELSLRNCSRISAEGFDSLSRINTFQRLDFYRTSIGSSPLIRLLKNNKNLRHINLGSCVSLTSMDEVAQTLGTHNHELISVDFWKTYSLTPSGVKALANCSKLEEVDFGWCLGVSIPGESMAALAAGCPRLRKLFLAALRGMTDRDLSAFLKHCPNLEQIDLLGVRSITPQMCLRILMTMKKLRLFDISFCDQLLDETVQMWRKSFPNVSIKRSFQSDGVPSPFQHY